MTENDRDEPTTRGAVAREEPSDAATQRGRIEQTETKQIVLNACRTIKIHRSIPLHNYRAGSSEMRSAALAIQGGGQADQKSPVAMVAIIRD